MLPSIKAALNAVKDYLLWTNQEFLNLRFGIDPLILNPSINTNHLPTMPNDPGGDYTEQQIIKVCEATIRKQGLALYTDGDSKTEEGASWLLNKDGSFKAEHGTIINQQGSLFFMQNSSNVKQAFSLCAAVNPVINTAESTGNYRNFQAASQQVKQFAQADHDSGYFHNICFFLHYYNHWIFWVVSLYINQDGTLFINENSQESDKREAQIAIYNSLTQMHISRERINNIVKKLMSILNTEFDQNLLFIKVSSNSTKQQAPDTRICGGVCADNFTYILQNGPVKICADKPVDPAELRKRHAELTHDQSYRQADQQLQPSPVNPNDDAECRQIIADLEASDSQEIKFILNAFAVLNKADELTTQNFRQTITEFNDQNNAEHENDDCNTALLLNKDKSSDQLMTISPIQSFISFCASKKLDQGRVTKKISNQPLPIDSEILYKFAHQHLKQTLISNQQELNSIKQGLFASLFRINGDDYHYQDGARDKLLKIAQTSANRLPAATQEISQTRQQLPANNTSSCLNSVCAFFSTCCEALITSQEQDLENPEMHILGYTMQ